MEKSKDLDVFGRELAVRWDEWLGLSLSPFGCHLRLSRYSTASTRR